ncbi:D-alanyl-D-alanine carboxypeptidase family protein [Enterococcus raffinosus]|uniref:D-alanyl-D-alanine carboxypeptidase family protein n=1 Tax=Enterococcus TaxID=1350 RepID=UPI001C1042EB|nr:MULTISPECIES: D-alanyl-D-alanine carboxypeptidase family protein [Enterococcus]MBU5363088.1 D-alanyl-D-alanine carboxypeptidase family protein [Enterococcus raffinosus]MDT2428827.1 D-alanyl-D-alanine carboxypeptidase family protein [Enterococcus avium]
MENMFLQLVNRKYPIIRKNLSPPLVKVPFSSNEVLLHPKVLENLTKLLKEAAIEGEIDILDGYRSIEEQKALIQYSIKHHGEKYTKEYVAAERCSEHHTGLAFDIGIKGIKNDKIAPTFDRGKVVDRFLERIASYGFILRYPKNKTHITKIGYEPWHFRYVGVPHSQIISSQGWVLEEYIAFIQGLKVTLDE